MMHEDTPSFVSDQLDAIASVSAGAVPRIIEVFVQTARDRVTALLGALEAGDWEQVSTLAHSLKGSSSSVGAERLARIAGVLEAHSHHEVPTMTPEVQECRAALLSEFEHARAEAEAYARALNI
jgi:histidine phosphotransfer protein HptB